MKRSNFLQVALLIICSEVSAGTPSAQVGSVTPSASRGPQRDQLIEIKIRRARWNIGVESLRSGPVAPPVQQDVKVAIAPAEEDLVSQQLVSVSCGSSVTKSAVFGPEGGIVTGSIDGVPADVKVVIAVEFVPATGLPSISKSIEKHIAGEGVLVLFQAFSDTTNMFIDRSSYGSYGDYLLSDLEVVSKEKPQPQRQVLLSTIGGQLVSSTALFNVLAGDSDPSLRLGISGRLQGYWPCQLALIESKAIRETLSLTPRWDPYRCRLFLSPSP